MRKPGLTAGLLHFSRTSLRMQGPGSGYITRSLPAQGRARLFLLGIFLCLTARFGPGSGPRHFRIGSRSIVSSRMLCITQLCNAVPGSALEIGPVIAKRNCVPHCTRDDADVIAGLAAIPLVNGSLRSRTLKKLSQKTDKVLKNV